MKNFFIIFFTVMMTISLSAYDLADVEDSFKSFADETVQALPLAANMGLNWNDAYSGSFPHFGVGLTAGAVFLPSEAFEQFSSLTGESGLEDFSSLGVPLPMYSLDARLGIPLLPMDIGVKFGALNPETIPLDSISVGFQMVGIDARWAVMEGKGPLPEISLGVGYTWLSGDIISPIDSQTVDISGTGIGASNLVLSDSDMYYKWSSNILDFKAQVSKKLLIMNLSAGAGYSYGISEAGGGISAATVTVDGHEITQSEISQLEDATGVSIDDGGLNVISKINGGSFRVFGGVGFNLFVLKLDVGLLYGVTSQTMGMTTNVRIQY